MNIHFFYLLFWILINNLKDHGNGYTLLFIIALKFTYAYQYMKNICIIIYKKI